jgi:hypothetical protein
VWRHVDQLDLFRLIDHSVRDTFFDLNTGDVLDDVGHALQVLDINRTDDGDTGLERCGADSRGDSQFRQRERALIRACADRAT